MSNCANMILRYFALTEFFLIVRSLPAGLGMTEDRCHQLFSIWT